ncbi:MAG TPA: hypothetical protein VKM55_28440 [Candidatus Lokiarchaeia archaeon]|nr:hypothetical protein [Candidatus Lokiarchaeia archaeon]
MAIEQKEQSASDKTELLPRSPLKLVGPGNGLIILGLTYLVWYVMPFSITFLTTPPDFGRSFHNWAYSMTIFIAGLAWYHKSPLSRIVLVVQAFIVPVTASGSVVTFDAAMINWAVALAWLCIVVIERTRHHNVFEARLQKRTVQWLNMHLMIITWLLIAHVSIVFFITRVPQETGLLAISNNAGFLANLPPELAILSTWVFDIALIGMVVVLLYEQFKMGYNPQGKPWPRWSFWWSFVCIGAGLVALAIQALTCFPACLPA